MSAEENIKATIQTYFDCMYESSAEKAHAAFHPNAKITGYLPTGLVEMTVGDFANFVASQPTGQESGQERRHSAAGRGVGGSLRDYRLSGRQKR